MLLWITDTFKMLTSASQYLQPDYLQPLPTTLDSKKSPLALLAQTCSAIGKDSGPTKSIIPPLEKKDKDNKDKTGTRSVSPGAKSGTSGDGRVSRPGSNISRKDVSPKNDNKSFRTPTPKEIPALVPISKTGDSSQVPTNKEGEKHRTTPTRESPSTDIRVSSSNSSSRISLNCGSLSLEVNHNESNTSATSSSTKSTIPTTIPPSLPSALKPDSLHAAAALGQYPGLPYLGHPFDPTNPALAASLSAAHCSLSAAHKAALSQHPGMSPYVKYTTVKTATGATTLVPVCSDPYCTHCKLSMQSAQLGTCAAGCTQCTHDKTPPHPASSLPSHYLSSLHGLASSAPSLPLSSSLYPHAFGVVPGSHELPYVCNWVGGADYCGKRFATPEELLSHLRSHTSSSDALPTGLSHYPGLPGLSGSALHSPYSTPGSISPNSLRQAYTRSLSPNTLIAASRYHPYKSPLSSLSTPGGAPSLSGIPPSLAPYYSPYALYAQRLGAVP